MNETITLPKLISLVAQATDCTPAEARKFVHDFFALIEQTLSEGEMVTIKGVGTFARTDNPSAPVKFQADDDLAAAVNEPFSAFQAVELNDGVTSEMLQDAPSPAQMPAAPKPQPEPTPEPEPIAEPEPTSESMSEEPSTISQPTFSVPPLAEDEEEFAEENSDNDVNNTRSHRSLWFVLGLLIGLIFGLIGGFIAGRNVVDTSSDDIDRIMAEVDSLRQVGVVDSVAVVDDTMAQVNNATQAAPTEEPKPQAAEVYDTVRSGYYLTTIAGKHYGHKNYWVFIYQANPGLGNPNTIGPGTRVKIPPLESFAESTEEATKAKAQQILNELHAKYNI